MTADRIRQLQRRNRKNPSKEQVQELIDGCKAYCAKRYERKRYAPSRWNVGYYNAKKSGGHIIADFKSNKYHVHAHKAVKQGWRTMAMGLPRETFDSLDEALDYINECTLNAIDSINGMQ